MSDASRLHYIEKVEYCGYTIKIVRRADEIRLLIYPPGAKLAVALLIDKIGNYEEALDAAKVRIDRMLRYDV